MTESTFCILLISRMVNSKVLNSCYCQYNCDMNCDISLEVFGEDLQEGKSRAFTFYIPATGMHLVTLSPRSFNTVLLNSLEKYLWRVKNMFTMI